MNASYFGYKSFYDRPTPQPYDQFCFSLQHRPYRLREVMGSRYVICASDKRADDPAARITRLALASFIVERFVRLALKKSSALRAVGK